MRSMTAPVLLFVTAALPTAALAQQIGPPAAPLEGMPLERGVYYHADSGWVTLPRTELLPFVHEDALSFSQRWSAHRYRRIAGNTF